MRGFILAGVLIILLDLLVAIPTEEGQSDKETQSSFDEDDFPEFDDVTEKPKSTSVFSRIGSFFNSVIQIPVSMFKAVNSIFSNQSFSKLREEVRNLNISYPKTG